MEMHELTQLWREAAQRQNICLNNHQESQLEVFVEHMLKTNQLMNLTRITDATGIAISHLEDSWTALAYLDTLNRNCNIAPDSSSSNTNTNEQSFSQLKWLDLGSGAGFPGIPLAILRPSDQVTLLDALQKRVRYLNDVATLCRLDNVTAVHGRAEQVGKNMLWRESQDAVIVRAVAPLSVLAEYALPLLVRGGIMIALKGALSEAELTSGKKQIEIIGGIIETVSHFSLADSAKDRTIVVVRKVKPTPAKFPRSQSQIRPK